MLKKTASILLALLMGLWTALPGCIQIGDDGEGDEAPLIDVDTEEDDEGDLDD
jgi:hypothetical protein